MFHGNKNINSNQIDTVLKDIKRYHYHVIQTLNQLKNKDLKLDTYIKINKLQIGKVCKWNINDKLAYIIINKLINPLCFIDNNRVSDRIKIKYIRLLERKNKEEEIKKENPS